MRLFTRTISILRGTIPIYERQDALVNHPGEKPQIERQILFLPPIILEDESENLKIKGLVSGSTSTSWPRLQ